MLRHREADTRWALRHARLRRVGARISPPTDEIHRPTWQKSNNQASANGKHDYALAMKVR